MRILTTNALMLLATFSLSQTQNEKLDYLEDLFSPKLGQLLTISSSQKNKYIQDHLRTKGYIYVNPKPDQCLIITTDPEKLDHRVCKRTKIPFQLKDIDSSGRISWRVSYGEADDGTIVSWQTPYRLANVVPLGELEAENSMNENVGIYACRASESPVGRKVELELFTGEKWYVIFPEKDSLIKEKKANPNLFVRVMTKTKDGKAATENLSSGDSGKPTITKEDIKRKHKLLALKLSGKYKEVKKKEYQFLLAPWDAFEMNSGGFVTSGTPMGLNGTCRYKYSEAPKDKTSGVVECYNGDEFDAVYLHMTCSSVFKPRKKPNEK